MPNRPESTWRRILKPDAFAMDCSWFRLHSGTTSHDSEAMACTRRRAWQLYVAKTAVRQSCGEASAGVRSSQKQYLGSKLGARALHTCVLGAWSMGELIGTAWEANGGA